MKNPDKNKARGFSVRAQFSTPDKKKAEKPKEEKKEKKEDEKP